MSTATWSEQRIEYSKTNDARHDKPRPAYHYCHVANLTAWDQSHCSSILQVFITLFVIFLVMLLIKTFLQSYKQSDRK